jgi:enoyl-CoA hydratase
VACARCAPSRWRAGRTWGAGADLFAACDLRVAAPDTLLRFPGAQFGMVLGTRRLAERIGADAARRLVLEGGELSAPQALAAGLASSVGDDAAPPPQVDRATAAAHPCRHAAGPARRRSGGPGALGVPAGPAGRIQAYRARLLAARPG